MRIIIFKHTNTLKKIIFGRWVVDMILITIICFRDGCFEEKEADVLDKGNEMDG